MTQRGVYLNTDERPRANQLFTLNSKQNAAPHFKKRLEPRRAPLIYSINDDRLVSPLSPHESLFSHAFHTKALAGAQPSVAAFQRHNFEVKFHINLAKTSKHHPTPHETKEGVRLLVPLHNSPLTMQDSMSQQLLRASRVR